MGLRLTLAEDAATAAAAAAVESAVFLEAFGNTPEMLQTEYGPYRAQSQFVVVLDEREAAGVIRVIVSDGGLPLKSFVDAASDPWRLDVLASAAAVGLDMDATWDVATLAVAPSYRSGASSSEVAFAAYHGLYSLSLLSGARFWVTILDSAVLSLLQSLGLPFRPLPGATAQPYLGSAASVPCYCVVDECATAVTRARPELMPYLATGEAFRHVDVSAICNQRVSARQDTPPLD